MLYFIRYCCIVVLFCACAAGCGPDRSTLHSTPSDAPAVEPPVITEFSELNLSVAPPSELCAKITSAADGWLRSGSEYLAEMPHENVAVEELSLRFTPQYSKEQPVNEQAFAYYAFDMWNHPFCSELKLIWGEQPKPSRCWIGLARPPLDDWQWLPMPQDCTIPLGDIKEYVSEYGILTVSVLVYGAEDCLLDYIRLGFNDPPEAELTVDPAEGEWPLEVRLDASGSTDSDGNIVRYDWDFDGDGKVDSRSYTQPWRMYTYTKPGTYNATVTVHDDAWDRDSASAIVTIEDNNNQPPHAELTADPTAGSPPLMVEFDASGSSDSDGVIVRWDWDFDGNGTVDYRSYDSPYASHEYVNEGSFDATVTVHDNALGRDTASVLIFVSTTPNMPPHAEVTADPTSGNAPLAVEFDASGSFDSDGEIVRYDWDFDGNGTTDYSDESSPYASHDYGQPGTFNAAVTVEDDEGSQSSATVRISVLNAGNQPPHAEVTADPTSGYAPLTVEFDASGSRDSDGEIVRYDWDFDGDGTIDYTSTNSPYASHTYHEDGSYSAVLTVTDNDDSSDSADQYVQIGYWAHTWGSASVNGTYPTDRMTTSVVDDDGNIYVIGQQETEKTKPLIFKYSREGTLLWVRTNSSFEHSYAGGLDVDSAGNLWVCNSSSDSESTYKPCDVHLMKYSSDGELLMHKALHDGGRSNVKTLLIDSDDNVYITGYRHTCSSFSAPFIVKYNNAGILQWARTYERHKYSDSVSYSFIDENGLITLAGSANYVTIKEYRYPYIMKVDSQGSSVMFKEITFNQGMVRFVDFTYSSNNEIYLAGCLEYNDGRKGDAVLMKLDSAAEPVWTKTWGGLDRDVPMGCAIGTDGCFYITGISMSFRPERSYFLLSFSPEGEVQWAKDRMTRSEVIGRPGMPLYLLGTSTTHILPAWEPIDECDVTINDITVTSSTFDIPLIDMIYIEFDPGGDFFEPEGYEDRDDGSLNALITTFY